MTIIAAFLLALNVNFFVSEIRKNEPLPAPQNVSTDWQEEVQ